MNMLVVDAVFEKKLITALEENSLGETRKILEEHAHSEPISEVVMSKAIDLNNEEKLDLAIVELMITSGQFDIFPKHHAQTKNSKVKFALAACKV